MFIVQFNENIYWPLPAAKPFTSDAGELKQAIEKLSASGRTALYDAIAAALDHLKEGRFERKILIILSDGGDNASRRDFQKLLVAAQQASVTLYTIGFYEPESADRNPKVLKRLAEATGGEAYFPRSEKELHEIWRRTASGIRNQYTLGYYPADRTHDGTYRKVRVRVESPSRPKMSVHTRPGYFAPVKPQTTPR